MKLEGVLFIDIFFAHEAFELESWLAEVDEHTDGKICASEIIQADSAVFVRKTGYGFQFRNALPSTMRSAM